MELNILKLAFLLGYLAMLVCMVSGIPFLTALFRSVLVTVIFALLGFFVRLVLLRIVNSVETHISDDFQNETPTEDEFAIPSDSFAEDQEQEAGSGASSLDAEE